MGDKPGHPFYGNQWTDTRSVNTAGPTVKKGDYLQTPAAATAGPHDALIAAWSEREGDADPGGAQAVRDFEQLRAEWKSIYDLQKEEWKKMGAPDSEWDKLQKEVYERAEARMTVLNGQHISLSQRAEKYQAREAARKALSAEPGVTKVSDDPLTRQKLSDFMPKATEAELRTLAMALPGSTVEVRYEKSNDGSEALLLRAAGGGIESSERAVSRAKDGSLVMENVGVEVDQALRGSGIGTVLFSEQVSAARAAGITAITAKCARALDLNGYYTWARMGYDGTGEVNGERPRTVRISEQMRTPEGRKEWRRHGNTFNGTFSLEPGSYSMLTLDAYLKGKGKN